MSSFLGEAELFRKKLFGKIASPATSCLANREKWGRAMESYFFLASPLSISLREH
jgi:hypothetical protein